MGPKSNDPITKRGNLEIHPHGEHRDWDDMFTSQVLQRNHEKVGERDGTDYLTWPSEGTKNAKHLTLSSGLLNFLNMLGKPPTLYTF